LPGTAFGGGFLDQPGDHGFQAGRVHRDLDADDVLGEHEREFGDQLGEVVLLLRHRRFQLRPGVLEGGDGVAQPGQFGVHFGARGGLAMGASIRLGGAAQPGDFKTHQARDIGIRPGGQIAAFHRITAAAGSDRHEAHGSFASSCCGTAPCRKKAAASPSTGRAKATAA
jgi:hypothetical protein